MDPFGELGVDLSPGELRETAYEILIGAGRSSASSRRLTYVSNSSSKERSQQLSPSPSHRQLRTSAMSQVKKALGLKTKKNKSGDGDGEGNSVRKRSGVTVGELMRVQMRVSEQIDSRVRRGILRVAAGQLGKRIESMVLPLELLQQFGSSDFPNQHDYNAWKKRNLKILEAGLLVHPHMPLDKSQTAPQRLREILSTASEKSIETEKNSESMNVLRNVVTPLALRSFDDSSDICHWADGIPLNLHLYTILLEACFDVDYEASIVEEVDEVLEQVKKTWIILGINQELHNLCFLWVLYNQYMQTGEIEGDLLLATDHMIVEVEKDANSTRDRAYFKILTSTLSLILSWAEKKLQRYHDSFYRGNIDVMQSILSIGVSAAKILSGISHEYGKKKKEVDVARSRVDTYIRSSIHLAFSEEREKAISSKKSSKYQQSPLPLLSVLAQNIFDLAFNEKEIYSPVLKRWHPLPTGVAVATLHSCYAKELKNFVSDISELNPVAIQVLLAAEKLEKDLVEMAVADSVDSEDGGKAIIQEMPPFEAEAMIANLVQSWIRTRVDRLGEWIDRNLEQEDWNPQVNKGRLAPSAVEVLRIIDETLEAFFLLPIPKHPALLPELMGSLDKCLQKYIIKAKSGCGPRSYFIPILPSLTRCPTGSKFSAFKRKDRLLMMSPSRKKSQVCNRNKDNQEAFSVPRLCLRINTLHNIQKELEVLTKRTMSNLRNIGFVPDENVACTNFGLSVSSCMDGIRQLSETTAYRIVFQDLNHVFWDYLYMGEISSSRIEPFLQELEQNLEVISLTVHDRVRTRVITGVMKASFEGFMLVLLAGGRTFSFEDAPIIEEDFKFLTDLFWSEGDGLPADLIQKASHTVEGVISLFKIGTENLLEEFKLVYGNGNEASEKSKLPLPPTTGQWGPNEPNTILRVLCHRNDKTASKFLKKAFDLPKKKQ